MAKYSTGGGSSGTSESCELCGAEDADLRTATVAGAQLSVCGECAQHGESGTDDADDGERDRKRRAAQNTARLREANQPGGEHWEDGADYDDDQLPYLVADYGQRLTDARQNAGLQPAELAEQIDVDESDIIAIEQGRATKAGIVGSTIAALEATLDVELAEST
jgi:ribosome-binding protein aMBF1 (putative translation factor)